MELAELIKIIARGEDSRHQFKRNINNEESMASELLAFTNSSGGQILLGVDDDEDSTIYGLSDADVRRLNQMVSNAASQHCKPPIFPETQIIEHPDGLVMVVTVKEGLRKPYLGNKGNITVKVGADKRVVTSPEEIQRMFQRSRLFHGDESPATGVNIADLDTTYLEKFIMDQYGEQFQHLTINQILENLNLAKDEQINVAGAMLFCQQPQLKLPAYMVKAVAYPGVNIDNEKYLDSRDLVGKLSAMYDQMLGFILTNIRHEQTGQSVNSVGEPLVPKLVLEELIANALVHRDYFISAPIKLFVFSDRVEIISPGHLPNNLTIEHIKTGNSNMRNPVISSFAAKLLPYRGIGSGIKRSLELHPSLILEESRDENWFKVTIPLHP